MKTTLALAALLTLSACAPEAEPEIQYIYVPVENVYTGTPGDTIIEVTPEVLVQCEQVVECKKHGKKEKCITK